MNHSTIVVSIKYFCAVASILLAGCSSTQSGAAQTESVQVSTPKGQVIHVFLLGGQSNALGTRTTPGLPDALKAPQTDVLFYSNLSEGLTTLQPVGPPAEVDNRRFGPEITFGRSLADYYAASGERVAILKYAEDATSLHIDWKPDGSKDTKADGPVYVKFQTTIAAGLATLQAAHPASTISIDGMIWMQGESDANPPGSPDYQKNLATFLDDIQSNYGPNLKFVIGRLSAKQTFGGRIAATDLNNVRTAQSNVGNAGPLNGWIDTDNFALHGDELHFNAEGQMALGSSFAKAMQALIASSKPAAPKK